MSQIAEWLVDGVPLLLLLLLLYYNEVEREKKFDFDVLRGKQNNVVNKKYTNDFFLITKRKRYTHIYTTHTFHAFNK